MWRVLYECELIEGSVLKSQMIAEGKTQEEFLDDGRTEEDYNKSMIKEGWAEIKGKTVTIYVDGVL